MNTKKEITRFLSAGIFVVAADVCVYYFLINFLSFNISKTVSFVCAGIVGYLLNKYWTFEKNQPSYAEAARYALINFLALGINVLTNQSVLGFWPGAVLQALVIATILTSVFAYISFKWWVFRTLPDTESTTKGKETLKARFLKLLRSNSSPHEIAMGMAVGVFIGISPFYGFHILTAFIAALAFRHLNKAAIFLGINISLPPTIPFITWAAYSIGRKLLGSGYPSLGWDAFRNFSEDIFFRFFYALLAGSFVLGTALSVLFYFITLWFLKRRRAVMYISKERGA